MIVQNVMYLLHLLVIAMATYALQVPADGGEVVVGAPLSAGRGDRGRRDGTGEDHSNDCLLGRTPDQQSPQPHNKVRKQPWLTYMYVSYQVPLT